MPGKLCSRYCLPCPHCQSGLVLHPVPPRPHIPAQHPVPTPTTTLVPDIQPLNNRPIIDSSPPPPKARLPPNASRRHRNHPLAIARHESHKSYTHSSPGLRTPSPVQTSTSLARVLPVKGRNQPPSLQRFPAPSYPPSTQLLPTSAPTFTIS